MTIQYCLHVRGMYMHEDYFKNGTQKKKIEHRAKYFKDNKTKMIYPCLIAKHNNIGN